MSTLGSPRTRRRSAAKPGAIDPVVRSRRRIRALLEVAAYNAPVEARPTRFFRGYDVFDPVRVGFLTGGAEAEREGYLLDTARPGNSNDGHTYGTELPAAAKRALLEYMKTL